MKKPPEQEVEILPIRRVLLLLQEWGTHNLLDGRQEVLGTHLLEFPRVLKLSVNRPVSQNVLHLGASEVQPQVFIKLDRIQLLGQLD